jgi:hypothetical protein
VATASRGHVSFNGVLPMNTRIRTRDVIDGTSKTIMLAEQSAVIRSASGQALDFRGSGHSGAWMGTDATGATVATAGGGDSYNTTTVRYAVGFRGYTQADADGFNTNASGAVRVAGQNHPFDAEHPGGPLAVRADGSVTVLSRSLELAVLRQLAQRDDEQTQSDNTP